MDLAPDGEALFVGTGLIHDAPSGIASGVNLYGTGGGPDADEDLGEDNSLYKLSAATGERSGMGTRALRATDQAGRSDRDLHLRPHPELRRPGDGGVRAPDRSQRA
jgi:hypothetical protein